MTCKPDDPPSAYERLTQAPVTGVRLIAKRLTPKLFSRKVQAIMSLFPDLEIYIDLPGGKPRLAKDLDLTHHVGNKVALTRTDRQSGDHGIETVVIDDISDFWSRMQPGAQVLIGDGTLSLVVDSHSENECKAMVTRCDFPLEAGRSVNILPLRESVRYPSLTDADLEYVEVLSEEGILSKVAVLVSFATLSTPWSQLASGESKIRIIPKVETQAGATALPQFVKRFEAVMIGRADLSLETSTLQCSNVVSDALGMDESQQIIVASLILDSLARTRSWADTDDLEDIKSLLRKGARRFLISGPAAATTPLEAATTLADIASEAGTYE